jgi:hypothetical protein
MQTYLRIATALSLAAVAHAAQAADTAVDRTNSLVPDAVFAQLGRASETTTITAGAQWNWNRRRHLGACALVTAYGELALGHWRADRGGGHAIVTQVGFTPVLRCWPSGSTTGWFVEGAIGVNALTPIYRTRDKRFSTAFNFGDHIALGYRMPQGRHWEWLLRLQHFSNAGIDHPNPGENFVQLRVVMPLERFDG